MHHILLPGLNYRYCVVPLSRSYEDIVDNRRNGNVTDYKVQSDPNLTQAWFSKLGRVERSTFDVCYLIFFLLPVTICTTSLIYARCRNGDMEYSSLSGRQFVKWVVFPWCSNAG